MVYLSLPYFYENRKFYDFLKSFCSSDPNHKLENFPCTIEFLYGNFPFCSWNGGVNTNISGVELMTADKIREFTVQSTASSIILDCSNINLESRDIYDVHGNAILKEYDNAGYFISVANLEFLDLLRNKYPTYKFVLSRNFRYSINDIYTAEMINEIYNSNIFELITLPESALSTDILKNIYHKNNIMIQIGAKREDKYEAHILEQQNIFSFSEQTVYHKDDCNIINASSLREEIKYYNKLGFTRFLIDEPPTDLNPQIFNREIAKLIIRPEYLDLYYEFELEEG